jgi:cell fate regulator YaaT (PSP1 superfamily)
MSVYNQKNDIIFVDKWNSPQSLEDILNAKFISESAKMFYVEKVITFVNVYK